MADDSLSLLFRLKADNVQAKATMADTRTAVAQLRQAFGPQLTQSLTIANQSFAGINSTLTNFVAQRVPLVGGAIVRVTEGLKGLGGESAKSERAISRVANSIQSIATQSGKSVPQVTTFLTKFVQLEGQARRNEAAFKFFGGSVDLIGNKTAKFLPELDGAAKALGEVSAESATAGASIAGIAGPVGIAVLAMAALAAGAVLAARQIFELAKTAAAFQGKLFDLSQQTGVSVETLSALEVVARTTGSSIEGLVQSLGLFQKNLEEAQDPGSKAAKTFKQLGIETQDTEEALRQALAALAQMPEGFRQTSLALEIFGRGGKSFLAIAKESKGDIDEITRKLGGLGLVTTEQAKLADEFNDQLVILDVQMRGLGTKAIPVILDAMKDLSGELERNRDLFIALQGAVKGLALGISIPLRAAVGIIRTEFDKARGVLAITAALFRQIEKSIEFISGHPITLPNFTTPPAVTPEAKKQTEPTKDPFTKQLEEQVEARRRLQGVLNFDFVQQQQRANASIALAQREFEAGKRTRESLLEATIDGIRKKTSAEIEELKVERRIKLEEQALAKDDLEKRNQLSDAIIAIDIQITNKRAALREQEKDEKAKFQQEEINNELAHQQRLLDRSRDLDQVEITGIRQQVALRKKSALDGDKEIENIELTAIDREQALLVRRLAIAGLNVARQKEIKDQIAALNIQRTSIEQRHTQERLSIVEQEADITLRLIEVHGAALIATTEALAEQRVITEEEAQKRIAKIRLDALKDEIELAQARGLDTRILEAQRVALQAETEREIEAGRQRDLDNEREYADELEEIKERVRDIERDAAEEVIRLMIASFARRRDIIRAQRDLDLQEEADRHKRVTDSINAQKRETDAEIRILEVRLERLEIGTTEEIEEHDRLIESLERLRRKRAELDRAQDVENERTQTRTETITVEARVELANPDAALRDVFDSIGEAVASLTGRFAELIGVGEQFSVLSAQLAQQIGGAMAGAFDQFANALGQTVSNWVLLGETGPAVMRKILAQALASLAAEAAVNAIKELALGFATLFFNPAEAAAHFTAAALWGSIGGVAAVAGRGIAGDLFKPKTTDSTRSSRGGDRNEVQPIDLRRPAPQEAVIRVIFHSEPGPGFRDEIVRATIDDIKVNGQLRGAIIEVAGE